MHRRELSFPTQIMKLSQSLVRLRLSHGQHLGKDPETARVSYKRLPGSNCIRLIAGPFFDDRSRQSQLQQSLHTSKVTLPPSEDFTCSRKIAVGSMH